MRTIRIRTKVKRRHPEHDLQKSFFQWLRDCLPKYRRYFYANVNAAKLSKFQGQWLIDEGKQAGVLDVFCMIPAGGKHGFYIEFKIGNNKLTSEQKDFAAQALAMDYAVAVCYTLDQAMKVVKSYLTSDSDQTSTGDFSAIS